MGHGMRSATNENFLIAFSSPSPNLALLINAMSGASTVSGFVCRMNPSPMLTMPRLCIDKSQDSAAEHGLSDAIPMLFRRHFDQLSFDQLEIAALRDEASKVRRRCGVWS